MSEFKPFDKIARWNRTVYVTEKLDGTNASIWIGEDGSFRTGSRNRWIVPGDDNYGFSKWAHENKEELMKLGPGTHFGEWWGQGIQRKYDLNEKRFSLFNVHRWKDERPACCHVVPILKITTADHLSVSEIMTELARTGSIAAPGFMRPEGIIIFHSGNQSVFKKTFEKDEGKGE